MKLELQINQKAPIDEDFWLYKVPVSGKQAIVGFPKFGVIGVGFQKETDWNTNLPSGTEAEEIYKHISHNKGDAKIPKQRCIDAIRLIQKAVLKMHKTESIEQLKAASSDLEKLKILSRYLRRTGSYEVAEVFDQNLN